MTQKRPEIHLKTTQNDPKTTQKQSKTIKGNAKMKVFNGFTIFLE